MALFSADITYPPLDVPKPVADGIGSVDSGPLRVFGVLGLPIRMTVLRLGDMLMHSPTRFDARLKAEIEAHGPIRHLVAPNIAHWSFLAEWQRHASKTLSGHGQFVSAWGNIERWASPAYSPDSTARSSRKRISRSLLVSEITKRTRPWLEVSA
jgi:hypothetical protein